MQTFLNIASTYLMHSKLVEYLDPNKKRRKQYAFAFILQVMNILILRNQHAPGTEAELINLDTFRTRLIL